MLSIFCNIGDDIIITDFDKISYNNLFQHISEENIYTINLLDLSMQITIPDSYNNCVMEVNAFGNEKNND